jgi:hypothetical protein
MLRGELLQHVSVGVVLVVAAALMPAAFGQAASCNACGVTIRFDQSLTCWIVKTSRPAGPGPQRMPVTRREPTSLILNISEDAALPGGHRLVRKRPQTGHAR